MSEKPWSAKDPDETKDYSFDWTQIIAGDVISTSNWFVVSGDVAIGNPASSYVGFVTSFWATGGTDNSTSLIKNKIVTTGGRTYERTRPLKIKSL